MTDRRTWRARKHPGSGITHDFANLLAVVGFVAVHRAFRADWLPRQKLAALQLLVRVNLQLATIQAETLLLPMLITAVQTYHERNGRLLGVQDSIFSHEGTILGIYDLLGQKQFVEQSPSGFQSEQLAAGTYILVLEINQQIERLTFIKK